MRLGTGDIVTFGNANRVSYHKIALDINKQRVYWLKKDRITTLYSIISSGYDGKNQNYIVAGQYLNQKVLGVSDNSIFIMEGIETRMIMTNETDSNVFRQIAVEKSIYFDLIVFNSNFNHTTGK